MLQLLRLKGQSSRPSCLGTHVVCPNKKTYYADAYHCVYHAKYVEQTTMLLGEMLVACLGVLGN